MSIFKQLKSNKGTVSSALGKELAARILAGEAEILDEVIELSVYELKNPAEKHIRAGAAKAVEIVAEERPELLAPRLESLLPALSAPEPQTRWMVLRTFGFCAAVVPKVAEKAIPFAKSEIERKEGLIVASSADLFLGDLGAVSREYATTIFPILEESAKTAIKNEPDWILEAFLALSANLNEKQAAFVRHFASSHADTQRKSTNARAKKLLKKLGEK